MSKKSNTQEFIDKYRELSAEYGLDYGIIPCGACDGRGTTISLGRTPVDAPVAEPETKE